MKFQLHRAIRDSDLPASTKLVLYTLWDYTNAEGGNAHPSHATLAEKSGLSVPSVRRHLRAARDAGWIRVVSAGGTATGVNLTNVYEFNPPAGVITDDQGGDHPRSGGWSPMHSGVVTDDHPSGSLKDQLTDKARTDVDRIRATVETATRLVDLAAPAGFPRRTKGALVREVEKLLTAGEDATLISATLDLWFTRTDAGPPLLPYLMGDAFKLQNRSRSPQWSDLLSSPKSTDGFDDHEVIDADVVPFPLRGIGA